MSDPSAIPDRCGAAVRVLEAAGLMRPRVVAAGPEAEIALVSIALAEWSRLLHSDSAALVAAVKAEGFRHVALDLGVDAAGE